MTKIQSDNYTQWKGDLINVTLTTTATLTSVQENVKLDSSGGIFTVTLPDVASMSTGKEIWFLDNGSAGTNNITIIPNPSDNTTIDGGAKYVVRDVPVLSHRFSTEIALSTYCLVTASRSPDGSTANVTD